MSDITIPRSELEDAMRSLLNDSDRRMLWELIEKYDPSRSDLFGKKATHKDYGEGIIISGKPDFDGDVRFAYKDENAVLLADTMWARLVDMDIHDESS